MPPRGTRGLNNSGTDGDYTYKGPAQFVEEANRDVLVAIQIETSGALEEVEGIAALPGVDLLFVGPSDLSLALGVVGQFHHAKVWDAMKRIAEACHASGKAWGCVTPDAEFANSRAGARLPHALGEQRNLRPPPRR